MKLKRKVKTLEGIDAKYHDLYEKKANDKGEEEFHLTMVEGVVEQDDIIKSLRTENASARVKNRELTDSLTSFADLKPEEVKAALLELNAVKEELAASGSKGAEAIKKAVDARLAQVTGPLEAKIKELTTLSTTLKTENEGHVKTNQTRTIHSAMVAACTKLGCAPSSFTPGEDGDEPDALSWASRNAVMGADGKVTTKKDGLPLEQALRIIQDGGTRGHWWGTSAGGGASGGGGGPQSQSNPWSAESWNITEQGKVQNRDSKLAESMAKLGGVPLGAPFHPKNGPPKISTL